MRRVPALVFWVGLFAVLSLRPAWADKISVHFFAFPFEAVAETYDAPFMRLLQHPEYGVILRQYGNSKTKIYNYIYSLNNMSFVYSNIFENRKYIENRDIENIYKIFKPETIFEQREKDIFIINDSRPDATCHMLGYSYLVRDATNSLQNEIYFIRVFSRPVAIKEPCAEQWEGERAAKVEAHALSRLHTAQAGKKIFISLPEGLAMISSAPSALQQLSSPLALSPSTWMVPARWLSEHDIIGARGDTNLTSPPYTLDFLLHNSKVLRDLLTTNFPYMSER